MMLPENLPVVLRPATEQDVPLLFQVYASTRDDVHQVEWSMEQKHAFLVQQFTAQDSHYRQHYPGADFLVIELAGQPIGRLYLYRTSKEHRLMEVTLLPGYRNQGLGTALMNALMQQSDAAGLPMTLHVEQFNPAYRMYQRLGFQDVGMRGMYMFMERPVGAGVS